MKDALVRAGRTAGTGVRRVCSPRRIGGAGLEFAWVAAHLAAYPFGMATEKSRAAADRFTLSDLPPVKRGLVIGDVEAAGTPILLIHGLVDNRSIFTVLRRSLRRRGFGRVVTTNYSVLTHDVPGAARALGRQVEALCATTGYDRIHVVGHSLGGVIARYYVQCLGGDHRVHTLATLGSPHTGTRAAHLLPKALVGQLRPGSALMAELAAPAPSCRTRFLAFHSDMDQLMVPKLTARIDHPDLAARNIALQGVGHMSLPIHGRVVHEIVSTFAHLDADGSTLTPGVTAIDSTPPAAPGLEPLDRRVAQQQSLGARAGAEVDTRLG
ncbi:MAG: alpha/beta fold hydrolase [Actinomycetota bacterium]|nr:alpha/beta fold hydrolase [Actinomycetota bacterium]